MMTECFCNKALKVWGTFKFEVCKFTKNAIKSSENGEENKQYDMKLNLLQFCSSLAS